MKVKMEVKGRAMSRPFLFPCSVSDTKDALRTARILFPEGLFSVKIKTTSGHVLTSYQRDVGTPQRSEA